MRLTSAAAACQPAAWPERQAAQPGRQRQPELLCQQRAERKSQWRPEQEEDLQPLALRIPASRRPSASAPPRLRSEQVWCSSIGTPGEARVVLMRRRPLAVVPAPVPGPRSANSIEVPVRLETEAMALLSGQGDS